MGNSKGKGMDEGKGEAKSAKAGGAKAGGAKPKAEPPAAAPAEKPASRLKKTKAEPEPEPEAAKGSRFRQQRGAAAEPAPPPAAAPTKDAKGGAKEKGKGAEIGKKKADVMGTPPLLPKGTKEVSASEAVAALRQRLAEGHMLSASEFEVLERASVA